MTAAMTVTVLGCSGSFASADEACTGFLVHSAERTVWLDAGPGTMQQVQAAGGLECFDAMVLTHEHPDHWIELPVLYNACLLYTSPSPRDATLSRMPSSA